MSREDDVGAAGVGEAAKDSRDELEDILKALEAGDSDKHGPNMKIIIGVIAGIVLVSVVLIIIMVNRKSVVPDFVGHTTAEAKQIAREAGVTLEEKKEYSSEVEEGCVISQDIAKGMKVKRKAYNIEISPRLLVLQSKVNHRLICGNIQCQHPTVTIIFSPDSSILRHCIRRSICLYHFWNKADHTHNHCSYNYCNYPSL